MNLIYVVENIQPYHEARLNELAKYFEVTCVQIYKKSFVYNSNEIKAKKPYKLEIVEQDFVCSNFFSRYLKLSRELKRILDNSDSDVVMIPGWGFYYSLVSLSWCVENCKIPLLMSDSTVDDAPRSLWREMLKRRILRYYDSAIVAGSKHKKYLNHLAPNINNVVTGYDVVDNDFFRQNKNSNIKDVKRAESLAKLNGNFILCVSRLVPKKNIYTLIDSFEILVRSLGPYCDVKLVVIGEGPLKSHLEEYIQKLKISHRVLFLGHVNYEEMPTFYSQAKLFVLASTVEQWGLVVNEALASALPVVVSRNCGCVPDLVHHGINGYTFDPNDRYELAQRLEELMRSQELCSKFSANARDVVDKFNTKSFAINILSLSLKQLKQKQMSILDRAIFKLLEISFARSEKYAHLK